MAVLLAEISAVGAGYVKQLCDYRGHATEVAGSVQPFHTLGRSQHVHPCVEAFGIYFRWTGGEYQVHTRLLQQRQIALHIAGVGVEILVGSELGGVDENRRGNGGALSPCMLNQRHMAGVERPHGGHQSQRTGRGEARLPHLCLGFDGAHEFSAGRQG